MERDDDKDHRPPSLDYATRGTDRVRAAAGDGREPRWYELDYSHRDLLWLIVYLVILGGLLALA